MIPLAALGLFLAGMAANLCPAGDRSPAFVEEWRGLATDRPWFSHPLSLAAGPDGSIYVLDSAEGRLLRLTEDGTAVSIRDLPQEGSHPEGRFNSVAAGGNAVYVNSPAANCIYQLDPEGRIRTRFPFGCHLNGLAVDPLGYLYVSGDRVTPDLELPRAPGNEKAAIWKLNRQGDVLGRWNIPETGAIAVGPDGVVWAATRAFEGGPQVLRRLSPFGVMLSEWELSELSRLEVGGLAVDARGHAYLTLPHCGMVVELDRQGRVARRWSRTDPGGQPLSQPAGVAVGAQGHLYIADCARSRIVKYDPETRR